MKKLKYLLGAVAISATVLATAQIQMPAPSPLATVSQKFGLGEINIEYSRPVANDRKIFGEVVPFDKIWRTGANGSTQITFSDVVTIQGQHIRPGTYAIYTIPHAGAWEIFLYSDLKLGGNVNNYDKKNEVARFKTETTELRDKVESFTINLDNIKPTSANLVFAWENTRASIEITTEIDSRVMKSIDESMESKKPAYFQAATYYYNNDKDLKKALVWAENAVKENPKAYYMILLKAKIEYKLGDKEAGNKSAMQTIEAAKAASNDDYVRMAEELMKANK
ncbi:MAG: DUF2911 domain-containing protein [Brumimicrobium sp.]|nr:DUF2911 domain-containing protein [Brumimicrobium sp.]